MVTRLKNLGASICLFVNNSQMFFGRPIHLQLFFPFLLVFFQQHLIKLIQMNPLI